MATYRELLQQVREQIDEIGISEAAERLEGTDPPLVVDVRERHEWDEGRLPEAVHIPRGSLESRIERAAPDRSTPILVYCGSGTLSCTVEIASHALRAIRGAEVGAFSKVA